MDTRAATKTKTTTTKTSFIVPATPTPPHLFFLSSLDLFWRSIHYNKKVLFFPTAPHAPSLAASLSLALSHFFPLAGRLLCDEKGRFAVNCNDAGVEFVEACIHTPFSDLGDDVELQPFFQELAGSDEMLKSDRCDIPLMLIQLTKFEDGGAALGISINHVLADGFSLWHFLISWGEIARGLPLSRPPLHERNLLELPNPSPDRARPPFGLTEALQEIRHKPQCEISEKLFLFTEEQIQHLKKSASGASSYECICAHIWKSFARARPPQHQHNAIYLIVLANCRKRLQPPLPDSYFGNAVYPAKVEATASELCEESLAATAARVHEAVEACTNEAVWDSMHWLELRNNDLIGFMPATEGLMAVSSPRFPVFEVDFGSGKAIAARPVRFGGKGEMIFFPSRHSQGGLELCMKLDSATMTSLLLDPRFTLTP